MLTRAQPVQDDAQEAIAGTQGRFEQDRLDAEGGTELQQCQQYLQQVGPGSCLEFCPCHAQADFSSRLDLSDIIETCRLTRQVFLDLHATASFRSS